MHFNNYLKLSFLKHATRPTQPLVYIWYLFSQFSARRGSFSKATTCSNQLVKLSQDEAPSDEDCHRLLMEYMPEYIRKTKITQRLFIKSVIAVTCLLHLVAPLLPYPGTWNGVVLSLITYQHSTTTLEWVRSWLKMGSRSTLTHAILDPHSWAPC